MTYERCKLCFGRGHRFRKVRRKAGLGLYCYPCKGCRGTGERRVK